MALYKLESNFLMAKSRQYAFLQDPSISSISWWPMALNNFLAAFGRQ
jgi:hypothetical protein